MKISLFILFISFICNADEGVIAPNTITNMTYDPFLGGKVSNRAKLTMDQAAKPIEGLQITEWNPLVQIQDYGQDTKVTVTFKGFYKKPKDFIITAGGDVIDRNSDGSFAYDFILNDDSLSFDFVEIDPLGKVSKQHATIYYKDWQYMRKIAEKRAQKRILAMPSIGFSSISHRETKLANIHLKAITGKVSLNYLLFPPRWDANLMGSFTLSPVQNSAKEDIRFINLNFRLGYIVPRVRYPWKIILYGGWYYTSMRVQNAAFGYQDVAGPQFYPAIKRILKNGDAIATYFKYSPVTDNISVMTLSNRELATGLSYIKAVKGGKSYFVTADYATIRIKPPASGGLAINTDTLSATVGIGF